MEKTETHLEEPVGGISVRSRRPLWMRIKSSRFFLLLVIGLATASIIQVGNAVSAPTPQEIIENQIEMNQEAYAEKKNERKTKQKEVDTLSADMIKIATQTAGLRTVLATFQ